MASASASVPVNSFPSSSTGTSFRVSLTVFPNGPRDPLTMNNDYCRAETETETTTTTTKRQLPPPGLPIPYSASEVADDSDRVPFLGTPYASNQPFDYPFPVNAVLPDPLIGPQKSPSALPIASSIASAPSLVQPLSDSSASLPSVVSSLADLNLNYRSGGSRSIDRPVLRHSRSNSSHISARSTKSLQSHISQGSGSSSPSPHTPHSISPPKPSPLSSGNSSPSGYHRRMTLAMAPSLEAARAARVTPRRPKSCTLSTDQPSKQFANPLSSVSAQSNGIGCLSSLSMRSIVDDKHIPPTLRSRLQQTGSLIVASYDAVPKSTEASARATPTLKIHDPPPTLRPTPLLKRPLPVRAYSHASSFVRAVPGPIQGPEMEPEPITTPSPTSTESSMKRVIKKTASLMELGLEGLKRAASGRSSANSRRSRTRAGSRA